jgi:hypothetical protein
MAVPPILLTSESLSQLSFVQVAVVEHQSSPIQVAGTQVAADRCRRTGAADLVPVQAQLWQFATSRMYPSLRALAKVVEAGAGTKGQASRATETLAPLAAPGDSHLQGLLIE